MALGTLIRDQETVAVVSALKWIIASPVIICGRMFYVLPAVNNSSAN
jgi:hypothetical protein